MHSNGCNSMNTEVESSSVANQDIAWYNRALDSLEMVSLTKHSHALTVHYHRSPNEEMLIRILNGRGNAYLP